MRGCGTVRPPDPAALSSLPCRSKSRSSVRAAHLSVRTRPNVASIRASSAYNSRELSDVETSAAPLRNAPCPAGPPTGGVSCQWLRATRCVFAAQRIAVTASRRIAPRSPKFDPSAIRHSAMATARRRDESNHQVYRNTRGAGCMKATASAGDAFRRRSRCCGIIRRPRRRCERPSPCSHGARKNWGGHPSALRTNSCRPSIRSVVAPQAPVIQSSTALAFGCARANRVAKRQPPVDLRHERPPCGAARVDSRDSSATSCRNWPPHAIRTGLKAFVVRTPAGFMP